MGANHDTCLPLGAFICPLCRADTDSVVCSGCIPSCVGLLDYRVDLQKHYWFRYNSDVASKLLKERFDYLWPSMLSAFLIQRFAPDYCRAGGRFEASTSRDANVYEANCQLAKDLSFFLRALMGPLLQ